MYLPQIGQFGRFCAWSKRANDVDTEEIFRQAISFINKNDKILVVIHCNAIKNPKIPEKYLFKKMDVEFNDSVVGYEKFCLYMFDKSKSSSILDFNMFGSGEFQNSKLSKNNNEIIIEKDENKLKLCKIPITINDNRDYLISMEMKATENLDNVINFDFYGEGYDNPEQQFVIRPDDISKDYAQIIWVVNSGEITSKTNVYFRIFTYSKGEAVIRNLEIYEIEYSDY